jgi:hypothetical protein
VAVAVGFGVAGTLVAVGMNNVAVAAGVKVAVGSWVGAAVKVLVGGSTAAVLVWFAETVSIAWVTAASTVAFWTAGSRVGAAAGPKALQPESSKPRVRIITRVTNCIRLIVRFLLCYFESFISLTELPSFKFLLSKYTPKTTQKRLHS